MLHSSEYQNGQTQKQCLPSGNPSHEHLTIIMVHTLFIHLYTYLSNTYLVYTSIAQNIPVHTKLSVVIYLYMQLSICILLFLMYFFFFILLLLSDFFSVTVILLHCGSFCQENQFLVCVNIPGNKAHSDSDYPSMPQTQVFPLYYITKPTDFFCAPQPLLINQSNR